jgi:hypothetical protein
MSGNQLESENEKWKKQNSRSWVGKDDHLRPKFEEPVDINGLKGMALEPQRIRTFEVFFKVDQT